MWKNTTCEQLKKNGYLIMLLWFLLLFLVVPLIKNVKKKSVIINCQLSRAMDLNKGQFSPPTLSHPRDEGRHLGISGDIFGCHDWGRWLLLASSGKRPRMLLNILQCIGQAPQQRIIQLKVPIVLNLRNRDLKKV